MKNKVVGLLILLVIYIISYFAGFGIFILLPNDMHIIFRLLIADIASTVVIWIFSIILKTASIYDPYWSVQTPVIILSLLIYMNNYNFGNVLLFIFIMIWAIRLTGNFIITFGDIKYCDWRYKELEEKTGKLYQFVNLFGIQMMPTVLVFVASAPAIMYIYNGYDFNAFSLFGYFLIILGVLFELTSDINIHKFKRIRQSRSEIINVGLWKYSRHPNYLGEILIWYGIALVMVLTDISYWYLIFGAVLVNMLFLFISIPLAEKKLMTYKDGYQEYKDTTRRLIPIPKRNKEEL